MAIELKTRIALKYDSYSDWQASDLVLLPGEVAVCEIPGTTHTTVDENGKTVNVTTAPTVLFKVGNDQNKKFSELPWASAKAADVYTWAKASNVKLDTDNKTLLFVGGNEDGTDKKVTFDFYTTTEVDDLLSDITERLAAAEAALGLGDGATALAGRVTAIEGKLAGIDSTVTAAITASEAATKTAYETYADQAEKDALDAAKGYADDLKDEIDQKDADQDVTIAANTKAIDDEATARAAADTAIEEKIGGSFSKEATVAKAISEAQAAAETHADDAIAALSKEGGAIAIANTAISTNAQAIAQEKTDREAADSALSDRLDTLEVFFAAADADGKDTEGQKTIYDALDTLKEIQDYILEDGSAADQMVKDISDNADAIEALESTVGDVNSGLVKDAADAKQAISALEDAVGDDESGLVKDVADLKQVVVNGNDNNTKLREDITELQGIVKTGADNNDALGKEIDAVATKVNDETTGLAATKAIADQNKLDIAELASAGFIKLTDFLAGEFVFNCGTADTVVHTDTSIPAKTQG